MKRSEINAAIALAKEVFDKHRFKLPKWAYWSPEDWKKAGSEAREVKECGLGWDTADFGKGDFKKEGLTLFTIRNGNPAQPGNEKTYCEKIMVVQVDQITPLHTHWAKMEDIINRGGGDFLIQLYGAAEGETLDEESDVTVSIDGVLRTVKAGDVVMLSPGESITLPPMLFHKFWAEKDACMVGEVSKTNDDAHDNLFLDPDIGRFPEIEEDEPPIHPLCNEYPDLN